MLDPDTKRWYQEFRTFIVYKSHALWKRRYPKFRASSLGDKLEGYALAEGLCEIPTQYAFLTSISEITPKLIRSIPADGFVVKDCLGNQGKQVLCIEKLRESERTLYRDNLARGQKRKKMTCHELVRHLQERMQPNQQNKETRILIEEYIPGQGSNIPPDYKVFVVDGKVRGIHLFWRLPHIRYEAAFTANWKRLPLTDFYSDYDPKRAGYHDLPSSFPFKLPSSKVRDRLIETAEKLAREHQALFCRYDFYVVDQRILLGEITPVCGGLKNSPITRKALKRFFPREVRVKYRNA